MSIGRIVGPLAYGFIWDLPRLGRSVFILTLLVVAAGPLLSLAVVFPKIRMIDDASHEDKEVAKYGPLLEEISEGVIEEQEGKTATWKDEGG